MTSHLVIALVILGGVTGAGYAVRGIVARRAGRLIGTAAESAGALPSVVYFTSADCAPCRLRQTPALEAVRRRLGETFALRTVDVAADPDTARRYRVLSAPTTVVLDARGIVRAVNTGVASPEVLEGQLRAAQPGA